LARGGRTAPTSSANSANFWLPGSLSRHVPISLRAAPVCPRRRAAGRRDLEENCFDRGWPGTGEFPLIEIVRTLAVGALRQVSPEVFSPHNATRSAAEIAALSSESLHALLDAANVAY
jgi:hypothetical protein